MTEKRKRKPKDSFCEENEAKAKVGTNWEFAKSNSELQSIKVKEKLSLFFQDGVDLKSIKEYFS